MTHKDKTNGFWLNTLTFNIGAKKCYGYNPICKIDLNQS